jgi:acyl-homoserine-lactone acylase
VQSDFAVLTLRTHDNAARLLASEPEEVRQWLEGYAAGHNAFLARTAPEDYPEECRSAAWVRPIDAVDVLARAIDLSLLSERGLLPALAKVEPPSAEAPPAPAEPAALRDQDLVRPGSNGWALGKDRTENGHGMLLANPHLPLEGDLLLHEVHLTIPGKLDAYGAGLLGVPGINIGFNAQLAWTHTTSPSTRVLLYRLDLDPSDPTRYRLDGKVKALTQRKLSIQVLEKGALVTRTRTVYESVHGPLVSAGPLPWTREHAFAFHSTGVANTAGPRQVLAMLRARTSAEFVRAHAERGLAWATTECATRDGKALFLDASRVAHLSKQTLAEYAASLPTDPLAAGLAERGVAVLDGSRSATLWIDGADGQGLVPLSEAPQLQRSDYVMNANDSYWLANASTPLTGFSPLFGRVSTPQFPRTRMNLWLLEQHTARGPSGTDGRFSRAELERAVLDSRGLLAELLREPVVERCRHVGSVVLGDRKVALGPACDALAAWDGTYRADSKGALLFREFVGDFPLTQMIDAGDLFAEPFDAQHPVDTPSGLRAAPAQGDDPIALALAHAIERLDAQGLALDAAPGDAQYFQRGAEHVPAPGCIGREGCLNTLGYTLDLDATLLPKTARAQPENPLTGLSEDGYTSNFGSAFVLFVSFDDAGPSARAVMTYSQSSDRRSPHFMDQSELWAAGKLRDVVFDAAAIAGDKQVLSREELGKKP